MEKSKGEKGLKFIKITAFAIALVLWFYVAFFENPERTFWVRNVRVEIEGINSLNNNMLAVADPQIYTINVEISAPRLAMSGYNSESVTAYVNVAGISRSGVTELPITVRLPGNGASVVKKNHSALMLDIEPMQEAQYNTNVAFDSDIATDCEVKTDQITPPTVKVLGAKSLMETISFVSTEVIPLEGRNSSFETDDIGFVAYDNDGNVINNLTFVPSSVKIKVPILMSKKIAVNPLLSNDQNKNVFVNAHSDPVYVTGPGEKVSNLDFADTEIIDISNIFDDAEVKAKLNLPDDISLKDSSDGLVTVFLDVTKK